MKRFFASILLAYFVVSCSSKKPYEFDGSIVTISETGGTYTITAVHEDVFKVSYTDSITYSDRFYAPVLTNAIPITVEELSEKST